MQSLFRNYLGVTISPVAQTIVGAIEWTRNDLYNMIVKFRIKAKITIKTVENLS